MIVSGRLRTREWTTEEGVRRSVVEMEASAVGPDLARCTATVRKPRRVEEPLSTGDETVEALDEFGLSDEFSVSDGDNLPDKDSLPDGVRLSDLAEAARPLVPVLA